MSLARYPRFWWRLLRRPQRVRLHGVRLELSDDMPEPLVRGIYRERYERGEVRCLAATLRPRDVVLEVGGGLGFLSTFCALRLGSQAVHTFESNPMLIDRILRTYALNDVSPFLTNAVLGPGGRERSFFVEPNFSASSLIRRSRQATEVVVPELDVNRVVGELRPTVVVMDIEGGEAELVPLVDWAGVRALVIELHPDLLGSDRTREVTQWLGRAGFAERRIVSSTRKKLYVKQ
jgi:FkbM family methyltransferase